MFSGNDHLKVNNSNPDDVTFVGVCMFLFQVDNIICRPGHLCSTTVLHYNAVWSHIDLYQKMATFAVCILP